MFLRYFWLVSLPEDGRESEVGSRQPSPPTLLEGVEEDDDLELPIWDTAVACLALSVKVCGRGNHARHL